MTRISSLWFPAVRDAALAYASQDKSRTNTKLLADALSEIVDPKDDIVVRARRRPSAPAPSAADNRRVSVQVPTRATGFRVYGNRNYQYATQRTIDAFNDISQGRRSLTLDFEGQGTKTTVVYGRFKDTFSSGSQGVVLLNIVFHENPPVIKKGDYGVVILPTGPAGKPTLLVVGEGDIFERARGSDSLDCWSPHGKEDGIFLGSEPAAGVLYFRKGWRFAFCGD